MGYFTKFDLEFKHCDEKCFDEVKEWDLVHSIIKELGSINPDYFRKAEFANLNDLFEEPMKWYGYEADMLELSKIFPFLVFILTGEGEDHDDNWITYFCNGEKERCNAKIVYDKPSKQFEKYSK